MLDADVVDVYAVVVVNDIDVGSSEVRLRDFRIICVM